jgi:hypothetical protein
LIDEIERFIRDGKQLFLVLTNSFRFPAKYYNAIFRNFFALRNIHRFPDDVPQELLQEVRGHHYFDLHSLPEETTPNIPIETSERDSPASVLGVLKERQRHYLKFSTMTRLMPRS